MSKAEAQSAATVDSKSLKLAAVQEWSFRHHFELEAAARFSRLSDELTQHAASPEIVEMAQQAANDERRHAEQCRELVSHFGGSLAEGEPPTASRVAPNGLSSRTQLLYEIVAMSCVTETLSCALLGSLVEKATDSLARETMHAILRDEVKHSRLGWAYLAQVNQHEPQHFLADYLPAMLAGTVNEELFQDRKEHPLESALSGLGALSRHDRLLIFRDTMRQVVFPGLQHFNIDTSNGQRWLDTQLKPTESSEA